MRECTPDLRPRSLTIESRLGQAHDVNGVNGVFANPWSPLSPQCPLFFPRTPDSAHEKGPGVSTGASFISAKSP